MSTNPNPPPSSTPRDEDGADDTEHEMDEADEANGEGAAVNDTEARYGEDESPA